MTSYRIDASPTFTGSNNATVMECFMEPNCKCKKMTLVYPRHRFSPEELLDFIEHQQFTAHWDSLGLNDDEDLSSLQLCIMANPRGDEAIEGVDYLHRHEHFFHHDAAVKAVTVYYAFFKDYGIAYLHCLDERAGRTQFTEENKAVLTKAVQAMYAELVRLKTIRAGKAKGGNNVEAFRRTDG
jgi:hypothetical protein